MRSKMHSTLKNRISDNKLMKFCRTNHIRKLAVFGSAIKNELRADSDLDILVEFNPKHIPGLLTLCKMQNELTDMVGRQVDMRTPEDLSRYFRNEVVETSEVQYEEI